MIYQDIRKDIRSGQLVAWSHSRPMWRSWYDFKIGLVRMFTKSEYSHVGITWVIGERVFVLEAVTPLVRNFPLSKLGDFYYLPLQVEWNSNAEEYALSHIGDLYSSQKAIQAFLSTIDEKEDTWQCAQYVNRILIKCGLILNCKDTPTALVKAAQELGVACYLVKNP